MKLEEYHKKYGYLSDGWHKLNPINIVCDECGSSNILWLWNNGDVVGEKCRNCGNISLKERQEER
ncbi:MAG: hypothetical protein ABSB40_04455 [Nitrososphaeria archaeon]|jgi:hypothetical protein